MATRKVYFDSRRCLGCHSCEFVCAVEHSESKDPHKAHLEADTPVPRRNVKLVDGACLTVGCQHCTPAPCVDACMSGAMRKDPTTGEVSCNLDQCVSCWMCVMACPFDAVEPGTFYAVKCDMCEDHEGEPVCVAGCPTGALFMATPEEFTERRHAKKAALGREPQS